MYGNRFADSRAREFEFGVMFVRCRKHVSDGFSQPRWPRNAAVYALVRVFLGPTRPALGTS